MVFTLPAEVAEVALANPRLAYGLLFDAASATLREVAADPKHLGAQVGVVAVLHTWGQNLHHHPHLHCLVTGGGLSCDREGRVDEQPRWLSCRPGFFLPVRVLSRLFRGKFLALLRQVHAAGQLSLPGRLAALTEAEAFASWLRPLVRDGLGGVQPAAGGGAGGGAEVPGALRASGGVEQQPSAVGDRARRCRSVWKDYAHGGKERVLTLSGEEFLRRWVQHVLPKGFVKVRHYGLLASRGREEKLAACRWQLLLQGLRVQSMVAAAEAAVVACCPACGSGPWAVVAEVPRPAVTSDTS